MAKKKAATRRRVFLDVSAVQMETQLYGSAKGWQKALAQQGRRFNNVSR
jgi:recombinational DNA repair ATPase RecF